MLELEYVRLGKELERVDRLRVRDRLEHGPIAQIGRDGAPFIPGRGDHAEPWGKHDLCPIVQRRVALRGVSRVIVLVFLALPPELRADRRGHFARRRGWIEV